ncbi:Sucrose synthase [Trichinella spiralis]|uniref:Sucrose synthase n=2 Tax=Trichinella spiralis TaxID=6334 RepID=A0ABR3KNM2_TRISP
MYHSNIKLSPSYGYTPPRYGAPYRTYVHHMDVDDAVDLYKKRCMTSSALVKYWLTPTNSETRRRRELREFEPLYQPSYYRMKNELPRPWRSFTHRLIC